MLKEDIAALDYILKSEVTSQSIPIRFSHAYPYLQQHFPNSYYTYVAGWHRAYIYSAGASPIRILEELLNQGNHPLHAEAENLWALTVAMEAGDPVYSGPARERISKIDVLDLPDPVKKYIQQFKKEKERQAAQRAAEKQTDKE